MVENIIFVYTIASDLLQEHTRNNRAAELLSARSEEAFSALYDSYSPALYGVIHRILRSEVLAEEALQDSFIKIWKNATSYDPSKGRPFTWMLQIARNTAIDYTRTARFQQNRKTDSIDSLVYDDESQSVNPEIQDSGLRNVIQKLDEKYRTLIELVYFKGYTQSDIEKELNIPLGTVKTRLRKAVLELRDLLRGESPGLLSVILLVIAMLIALIN